MKGDFTIVIENGRQINIRHKQIDGCKYIWNLEFFEYKRAGKEQVGSGAYTATYGRGLEDVDCDLEFTENDIAQIENLMGEMVQDYCRERELLCAMTEAPLRKATRQEAYESLIEQTGIIKTWDGLLGFVQF